MNTQLQPLKMQTNILAFLATIKDSINSIEEFIGVLHDENQKAEVYGQQNIGELLEISTYQWQLEQIEMKLKAPSLIRICWSESGFEPKVLSEEEKIEAEVLSLIIRLVRETKI